LIKSLKLREIATLKVLYGDITDRNNLDEQLYGVFSSLPIVKHVESIKDLQQTIKTSTGGIILPQFRSSEKRKLTNIRS
jgi:type I site-specific restriction-modification system R (restriction) subunit